MESAKNLTLERGRRYRFRGGYRNVEHVKPSVSEGKGSLIYTDFGEAIEKNLFKAAGFLL